jgi:hypothetical protein
VITVAFLIGFELATGVGRGEGGERAVEQRRVVGLELQGVMRPPRSHLGSHGRMAMQGIAGDDAAFQNQAFEHRQRGRNLIAARRVAGCQRQPRLGIPHAHHERRHVAAAALIAAPQALAVDGDHACGRVEPEPLA